MELDFRKDPAILAAVVDAMADGVFTVDASGNFAAWSEGAERITGYRSEDVVGRPCTILEGPNCKGFGNLRELMNQPPPVPTGICNQECKVLSRDGRELHLHGNVRVLTDSAGKVQGAVGTFADMTSFVTANERIALLEEQSRSRHAFEGMVGKSAIMQEVFRRIRLAAQSDVTVLVTGESGTGKELAARAVHSLSDRKDKPFIAVNCSALPETLLESELFGHVRGAFTGAIRDKTGVFQAADGGTLFLDEIGDVSPLLQLKLLRALETREIRRVGDDRATTVNVRLVTATNRDLAGLIAAGTMREDFYYRIRVFEIRLPSLRERREDLPLLVNHFLGEAARGRPRPVTGISHDALQKMMDYGWPGNVRELRNAIEHALVTVQGEQITLFDLPPELRTAEPPAAHAGTAKRHRAPKGPASSMAERMRALEALRQSHGNRTEAARLLGISRVALWKKLKRLGIDADTAPE